MQLFQAYTGTKEQKISLLLLAQMQKKYKSIIFPLSLVELQQFTSFNDFLHYILLTLFTSKLYLLLPANTIQKQDPYTNCFKEPSVLTFPVGSFVHMFLFCIHR